MTALIAAFDLVVRWDCPQTQDGLDQGNLATFRDYFIIILFISNRL